MWCYRSEKNGGENCEGDDTSNFRYVFIQLVSSSVCFILPCDSDLAFTGTFGEVGGQVPAVSITQKRNRPSKRIHRLSTIHLPSEVKRVWSCVPDLCVDPELSRWEILGPCSGLPKGVTVRVPSSPRWLGLGGCRNFCSCRSIVSYPNPQVRRVL